MLDRRSFLTRSGLAIAGGLIVGDEALALFERLTHRKVWALGAPPVCIGMVAGFLGHITAERLMIYKALAIRARGGTPTQAAVGSVIEQWAPEQWRIRLYLPARLLS